jgi:hypothetical protein
MKNTEYRKGNLVVAGWETVCFDSIQLFTATIAGIEVDEESTDLWVKVDEELYAVDTSAGEELHGIPITEEWLNKFEFDYSYADSHGTTRKKSDYLLYLPSNAKTCDFFFHTQERRFFLKKIEYIHQLQNLFWAITDKELELKKEVADGLN